MRARTIVTAVLLAALLCAGWTEAASAETYPINPPPTVLSVSQSRPAEAPVAVAPETTTRGLALTGADIAGMVVLGGGLIVLGAAVRRGSRRRVAV